MVRTRLALILYFRMAAIGLMSFTVNRFLDIIENMVQILLTLELLFIQGSKAEDMFCGAPFAFETNLCFSNDLFGLGLEAVQDDFQNDFLE